jgi:hypothetical protein
MYLGWPSPKRRPPKATSPALVPDREHQPAAKPVEEPAGRIAVDEEQLPALGERQTLAPEALGQGRAHLGRVADLPSHERLRVQASPLAVGLGLGAADQFLPEEGQRGFHGLLAGLGERPVLGRERAQFDSGALGQEPEGLGEVDALGLHDPVED